MSPVHSAPAEGETNGIFSLCLACLLYLLAACTRVLARSHSAKWNSQQVSCWANFARIYRALSSLSHYLFKVRCSYCNSAHGMALTYSNLQQNCLRSYFSVSVCISFCMLFFDLPPGIMRDRAPVETDFGTLATAPVFSAALSGRRELFWAPWSAEVWLVLSGLSTPSPLGVNWSRCSEKLPVFFTQEMRIKWGTELHRSSFFCSGHYNISKSYVWTWLLKCLKNTDILENSVFYVF